MAIMDFLQKYFITPIYTDSGYNLINTITYAIIAIVALVGIYKLLKKLNVHIDYKLFYAVFPFIIFGSSLRTFVDSGTYKIGFWTVSPGIYILTAAIFLAVLGLSVWLDQLKKIAYWKTCLLIGISLVVISFGLVATKLNVVNVKYGLAILGLALIISLAIWIAFKLLRFKAGTKHFLVFPAHMLDAAATFIAVDFLAATEKHPLPVFATNIFGTAAIMFALKLLVLIPLVYFMDKEFEDNANSQIRGVENRTKPSIFDKQFVTFMLISVAVLGFAEGIRDLLTIMIV
jgi:uncharacterized membrane protein